MTYDSSNAKSESYFHLSINLLCMRIVFQTNGSYHTALYVDFIMEISSYLENDYDYANS
jgi:hypothetical protein